MQITSNPARVALAKEGFLELHEAGLSYSVAIALLLCEGLDLNDAEGALKYLESETKVTLERP